VYFLAAAIPDLINLLMFDVPGHALMDFLIAFLATSTTFLNPQPPPPSILRLAFIPVVTAHDAAFSLKPVSADLKFSQA
jgi:hypothetical protein